MIGYYKFIDRIPIEERDGRLYAAGVCITPESPHELAERVQGSPISGFRISEDAWWRLDAALAAEAEAAGENLPVAFDPKAVRVHRCLACKAMFLARTAARTCSDECRQTLKRATQQRYRQRQTKAMRAAAMQRWRAKKRTQRLATLAELRCRQCGAPIEGANDRRRRSAPTSVRRGRTERKEEQPHRR
jgi:hypothetical protein